MATTKKAIYKVHNGTDFDTIHFETEASQVKTAGGSDVETQLAAMINTALNSPNGWFKDQKTGMIIQWGTFTDNVNTYSDAYYNFPIAFPTCVRNLQVSINARDSNTNPKLVKGYIWYQDLIKCRIRYLDVDTGVTERIIYWIAIGF